MHKVSRGPSKCAVSAQKALQTSKMETMEFLGGTEENSVSLTRSNWFTVQSDPWNSVTQLSGIAAFEGNKICESGGQWTLNFLIKRKSYVFINPTIKVCVNCSWRCPGTSAPSVPHLMVSLCLCSPRSNARSKPRSLEGRCVCSKSPSRIRDGDHGIPGKNRRE